MAEAERSGDPVVLAAGVRVHAHVLVREKHTAQAVHMVRNTVDQLSGSYDQRSPRYLAAVGLLLRGATAASRNGDRETTWRSPGEPRPSRPADAIAVAPATFNTVNKWAAGISDNLALGILCEAPAMGVPVAVLPYLNSAQAAHPAYRRSLDLLREMGVLIGSYEPHRPKAGGGADRYRWEEVLELLDPRLSARS